jgi:hypothetical protein
VSTPFDFPDWQTPQAHASRIAATGVPLLRAGTNVKAGTGTTIAGGASSTLLTAGAISQPGYEISIQASMPAGTGTLPFVAIELLWTDVGSTLPTARRDIVITAGNAPANAVTSFFNGPCRGGTLQVIAKNLDPAVTVTLNWAINQTSHVYEHDQAGQLAYPATAPHGYSNPGGVSGTGVIVYAQPSLAAGASAAYLCALYGGDVFLMVDTVGISVPVGIEVSDAAGYATGTSGGDIFADTITGGTSFTLPLTLPYTPALLTLSHLGTATIIAPKASLVAQNH